MCVGGQDQPGVQQVADRHVGRKARAAAHLALPVDAPPGNSDRTARRRRHADKLAFGAMVTRCATPEEVWQRVAEVLAASIDGARTIHGRAHVALSGGSAVNALNLLGPMLPDWRQVHLWYGDERCVPLDDPESNHYAATENLTAPEATWHPVPTHLGCEQAAEAYSEELLEITLDVALNGMGPDGHTASLLPGFAQATAARSRLPVHD